MQQHCAVEGVKLRLIPLTPQPCSIAADILLHQALPGPDFTLVVVDEAWPLAKLVLLVHMLLDLQAESGQQKGYRLFFWGGMISTLFHTQRLLLTPGGPSSLCTHTRPAELQSLQSRQ